MLSTFSGLETARRALMTQQQALYTVGHNVANANTAGYTRQRTEHLTQPILLFVPTIAVVEQLSDALSLKGFSHGKVYADARDRHRFRKETSSQVL